MTDKIQLFCDKFTLEQLNKTFFRYVRGDYCTLKFEIEKGKLLEESEMRLAILRFLNKYLVVGQYGFKRNVLEKIVEDGDVELFIEYVTIKEPDAWGGPLGHILNQKTENYNFDHFRRFEGALE